MSFLLGTRSPYPARNSGFFCRGQQCPAIPGTGPGVTRGSAPSRVSSAQPCDKGVVPRGTQTGSAPSPPLRSLGSSPAEFQTAQHFVRDLVRLRALRALPAVRRAASSGWARRWWGAPSVAVQLAVASTALGRSWPAVPAPAPGVGPALDRVLDLAADEAPSRLPLRP